MYNKKSIDCLLIGHNEMDFTEYEKHIKRMGVQSGAYRDLNLNFVRYNNRPYNITELFNFFFEPPPQQGHHIPIGIGETFSAAIAYLGTYLHRRGFTFAYVNWFQEEKEELSRLLLEENILTIAIITTLYVSVLPILEIVEFIRKNNQNTKIIIGGPFISTKVRTQNPSELDFLFKSMGADYYVNSTQGETALGKIIRALKLNLPVEQINNIYYKTTNGYAATPVLRENNKLSENMVDWSLFSDGIGQYTAVRTSISCPYFCAFCGFPEHAGKYQVADVPAIIDELSMLNKIETLTCVHFIDDTFNVPKKRFKELLKMMIKNKYRFKWHSYFRCQLADREMVELMKESGCEGVFLGLESANNQILKNMNKVASTHQYLKGISLLKEYGIVTFGNFIIGFPGETNETVQDTKQFIQESGIDFYRVQLWYCEPITPIWKKRDEYNIHGESFEWKHRTMDANTACTLIENLFLSIENPTWVPQYNFDFDNFWHLVHSGLTLDQTRQFLKIFNQGVKEKLKDPTQKEIGFEIIRKLKNFFDNLYEYENENPGGIEDIDKYQNMFDF